MAENTSVLVRVLTGAQTRLPEDRVPSNQHEISENPAQAPRALTAETLEDNIRGSLAHSRVFLTCFQRGRSGSVLGSESGPNASRRDRLLQRIAILAAPEAPGRSRCILVNRPQRLKAAQSEEHLLGEAKSSWSRVVVLKRRPKAIARKPLPV